MEKTSERKKFERRKIWRKITWRIQTSSVGRFIYKKIWGTLVDYIGWDDVIAFLIGLIGVMRYWDNGPIPYNQFWDEIYTNIHIELIGIAITVILISNADQYIRNRIDKKRIVLQLGSPDNGFALEAARQLRSRGWLVDGTVSGNDLDGANLYGAKLHNADLSNTSLIRAIFDDAYLNGTNFQRADLTYASFKNAKMTAADLRNASLWKANFEGASLTGGNLAGAELVNARFQDTNLRSVNFSNCQFEGTDFSRADFRLIELADGTLEEFSERVGLEITKKELVEKVLEKIGITFSMLASVASLSGTILPDGTKLSDNDWKKEFDDWCKEWIDILDASTS